MSVRRLKKELADFTNLADATGDLYLQPADPEGADYESLKTWRGHIRGPANSPYAGGVFPLTVEFPREYPFNVPKMAFTTKIYHPEVAPDSGAIVIAPSPSQWSPAWTINTLMTKLLGQLNLTELSERPVNLEALNLLKSQPTEFCAKAAAWTKEFARGVGNAGTGGAGRDEEPDMGENETPPKMMMKREALI